MWRLNSFLGRCMSGDSEHTCSQEREELLVSTTSVFSIRICGEKKMHFPSQEFSVTRKTVAD